MDPGRASISRAEKKGYPGRGHVVSGISTETIATSFIVVMTTHPEKQIDK